jgi:hypothetical protein
MTNEDILSKFLHNAEGVISPRDAQWVAERVMNLEQVDDINSVMSRLRPAGSDH